MKKSNALMTLLAVNMFTAVGCEQKKMSMEEMMAPPPRPVELDRLNAFMGQWRGESDMVVTGMDETMTGEGASTVEWGIDNRYMVERFQHTSGENTMEGMALWTWDDESDLFRSWWFSSDGTTGTGTIRFDEDDNLWRMKTSGKNMVNGQKSVGGGTLEFVDADTMKWDYSEWDSMHLVKLLEMHGTSHRQ